MIIETDGKISFERNIADGKFTHIIIHNNGFMSLQGEATAEIKFKNIDRLAGEFSVSIECADDS